MKPKTFSEIMRHLNKKNPKALEKFLKSFKSAFDSAYLSGEEEAEMVALMEAMQKCGIDPKDLDRAIGEK